ncbi:galactose-1-phosphate uridylyltransferase [Streptomyces radicis]|uniref:Galactose-1-phosphate uridylyltransferase n=1 Tax=Streptomyces radicis TaxID=1750517 RepID=A0A3A9W617_9ACTN|nr:galactose-1-phosphate uridylyltransferase [Streptomyces radicis]RKN08645.1 galactose-1-phosphate uridylyltransferase [Streptomyces radicis]RKN21803.1 galactose-1-phosphate uridylyltransferase [Streptomyces radicis]
MKRTTTRLADGRELLYYDRVDGSPRAAVDRRPLPPVDRSVAPSEIRHHPLLGEPVAYAAHRQARTYHPPADQCPLCPSRGDRLSEIPAESYEVAVFENRFPSFGGDTGRCEVVCFTSEHDASFASLTEEQAALVLHAWTDRTAELLRLPGVTQVYCFENRGVEIGVTLAHPHGQIYGYPYVTPFTRRAIDAVAGHRARTGANLYDEILAAERADGRRVVLETGAWTAFVPHAARWPYEVHLYPRRRVPDLTALDEAARAELPGVYLELLRRFDRIFGPDAPPTPYISGWHQAPVGIGDEARDDFALRLELFTIRRSPGKLKYLAGSESGVGAFVNDVLPEAAADRLREVASGT